ncbi:hypothetical protein RyT2_01130 [Pseudolactococcus yaeyamensis]
MKQENNFDKIMTLNQFKTLNDSEASEISGGIVPFVITGAMVIKGISAFGAGVALGTLIAKKF